MKTVLATAAVLMSSIAIASAQDVANGEKVFNKCKACHAVGEGATNKVGPVLNGVIGRKAASIPNYSYSAALKKASEEGLVLNEENIAKWVSNPKAFVPGNKMSFVGLQKEQEVKDVIAYLAQFDESGKKK